MQDLISWNPPPQRQPKSHKRSLASSIPATFSHNVSIASDSSTGSDILLSPDDCDLWSSSFASKYAAGNYLPVCRRLGVISRTLQAVPDDDGSTLPLLNIRASNKRQKVVPGSKRKVYKKSIPIPTITQAKKHIQGHCLSSLEEDCTVLESRAKIWQNDWKKIRDNGPFQKGWNETTGEIPGQQTTCRQLLGWITGKEPKLQDLPDLPKFCSPYSNQKSLNKEALIPFDTESVLKALVELMTPLPTLYDQPLIVTTVKLSPQYGNQNYHLSIGIYANRLLFEIMTQQLQVVMAALDPSSFQIYQHLHIPPSLALAKDEFESAPFPQVILPSGEIDDHIDEESTAEKQEGSTRCNTKTIGAFSIPGLFKLIENKGTFDEIIWNRTLKPKLARQPNAGLNLDLLLHQKHGVCWMYQMERLGNLNQLIWQQRSFQEGDSYFYSPALGQMRLALSSGEMLESNKSSMNAWGGGGILADEMGLGKTIQVLALIVATLGDIKQRTLQQRTKFDKEEDKSNCRHSTLIIVPPALLSQWISEIKKAAPWLVVDALINGSWGHLERVQQPINSNQEQADIVMTTYQALEDNYLSCTKKKKKKHARNTKNSNNQFFMSQNDIADKIVIADCSWGRIILDEMQVIRSWTTRLSKLVNSLDAACRWMLSGTPFLDDVTDLRGELCFLKLEPFSANNDDGFFQFAVANHWDHKSRYGLSVLRKLAELIMLRRSKSMMIRESKVPLLGLKPFTLTFEPVPQDPSERALYCFLEFLMHSTVPRRQEEPIVNDDNDNNDNDDMESKKSGLQNLQQQQRNKTAFLRLLRELCVSPTLLNGGLGCPSQLDTLNRWMKDYNKQLQQQDQLEETRNSRRQQGQQPSYITTSEAMRERVLSCDEAVRFLSQVEDLARTDSDFITDVRLGGGAGVSNRNRAFESSEERHQILSNEITRSKNLCESSSRKRAKANWQKALECITTGRLFASKTKDLYQVVNRKIRSLWGWRYCVLTCSASSNSAELPSILIRGWRPSENFVGESPTRKRTKILWKKAVQGITTGRLLNREDYSRVDPKFRSLWYWRFHVSLASDNKHKVPELLARGWHPSVNFSQSNVEDKVWERIRAFEWLHIRQPKFYWANPFGLLFSNIPGVVTRSEIRNAVVSSLQHLRGQSYNTRIDVIVITPGDREGVSKAVVFLNNKIDYDHILKISKQKEGIELVCSASITFIDDKIRAAKIKLNDTIAANRVHPCVLNSQNEVKAKKEFEAAKRGLRIFGKETLEHVCCVKTLGSIRGVKPLTYDAMCTTMAQQIEDSALILAEYQTVLKQKELELKSLVNRIGSGITDQIGSLTTFEALQILKSGQGDQTTICPICFDSLGQNEKGNGLVCLTRCGHLCCKGCMMDWIRQKERSNVLPSCIECRKPVSRSQLVFVDPKKAGDEEKFKERQVQAKSLVQTAADMLNANHGQLSPQLWEALYLSMDLPDISHGADIIFTAIPAQVLSHLRHATAMPVNCTRKQPTGNDRYHLSSKIRALLSDLPRDELSVVFASSKVTVQHLLAVFMRENIGCRGLFTGQTEKDSELAISEWQNDDTVQVLVVQAGAAACGLTLTVASKMFLMDPFLKHEEEKQAYARLHRYGQTKEVFCKVYYSPVSVESRLLEWRHRQGKESPVEKEEEKMVFAPLRDAICVDISEEENFLDEDSEDVGGKQTQFLLGLT